MWSISSTLFDYTVLAIVTDTFWIVVLWVAGLNSVGLQLLQCRIGNDVSDAACLYSGVLSLQFLVLKLKLNYK